jgi:hypothetical protein
MIIARLASGLGNQMFQYAAGLALAERHRTVLKLDVSSFGQVPDAPDHERYSLHGLKIIEQFATRHEVDRLVGFRATFVEKWALRVMRKVGFRQFAERFSSSYGYHSPSTFAFYPEFDSLPNDTFLDGLFQSEKFFHPVAHLLRKQFGFRYDATPETAAYLEKLREKRSVAIHVRRGDLISDASAAERAGVIPLSYYDQALIGLRRALGDLRAFIFSDDVSGLAREWRVSEDHVFVQRAVHDPLEDLRLMSMCDHFIIANSTYSWWAAWLGSARDKQVIAPDPWFRCSSHDATNLIPPDWTRRAWT